MDKEISITKNMEIPLISKRLSLRAFTKDDANAVQEIAEAPGFHFVLLDGSDAETGEKFVAKCMNEARILDPLSGLPSHYRLAVVVRNTGALAGYVGLFNIDYDRRDGEIGFFIAPRLQGNGYASEAADNLVKAAQQIGLDNVYATAREDNAASRRIIEKRGMQKESVIPNKYHDNVSTRLLFRRRLRNGPSL